MLLVLETGDAFGAAALERLRAVTEAEADGRPIDLPLSQQDISALRQSVNSNLRELR